MADLAPAPSDREIAVAVVGHVDSGKSTLVGHMLELMGVVSSTAIAKLAEEAEMIGKGSYKWAFVTDRQKAERERGITIDFCLRRMVTADRDVTLIDTPGHRDFFKNAASGMVMADHLLLVVDASPGAFEASIQKEMGNIRPALFAHSAFNMAGIVVAVSKMDHDTVNYSQERYEEVVGEITKLIKKVSGARAVRKTAFVPISAWTGAGIIENVAEMDWHTGPTLVEAINDLTVPEREEDLPLRLMVSDSYKVGGIGTVPVGRLATGVLQTGDRVAVAPTGAVFEAKQVNFHTGARAGVATAGDNTAVNLKDCSTKDVKRGYVLGLADRDPPRACASFDAQLFVIWHPGQIAAGYSPIFDIGTAHVACRIDAFLSKVDRGSGKTTEDNPLYVRQGEMVNCRVIPTKPICVEKMSQYRMLGRFLVRDMRRIVAVGYVSEVYYDDDDGTGGSAQGSTSSRR